MKKDYMKKDDIDLLQNTAEDLLENENPKLAKKFRRLCNIIKEYESGVVAFSGGVDSSLLAYLCQRLFSKTLCVTADSPTTLRSELADAIEFAKRHNLNHRVISYNELEDERFVRNDEKRCFYCKDGLFRILNGIREEEGYNFVIDGSNYDDIHDFRPGREAARINHVKSPLIEAELTKKDIRIISKILGLDTWDKPQMACLSSRFPRDIPIKEADLRRIEKAETLIKKLGHKDVRVRFHGEIARIEIGNNESIQLKELKKLVPKIKKLGFKYVALDLEGYRTGSLNE
ncbi:MAG: ATP-dependent sacrificial sulfur transferase LarE [Methanomassiliicoccales archaeon]|nr:MAG: ATP-dependent sacrificial sulfur transferase LarE [Methanomassiliicoccales archaeon]